MKPRVRSSVSVVLVTVTFVVLPYLFFYYNPSAWCGLACLISRNNRNNFNNLNNSNNLDNPVEESPLSSPPQLALNKTFLETRSDAASDDDARSEEEAELEAMLREAATRDKTVIITTLNQAWASPGTMIDVFLESFRKGEGTEALLEHLVVVALDQRSFLRCRELHRHCLRLRTRGVDFSGSKGFMSQDFLKMMWRRMSLLRTVLELGYSFIFTDADILWLRNPFEQFAKAEKTDFQISCDKNQGNKPGAKKPNCGFQYARSNKRTIAMFRRWCGAGAATPSVDEQSLLTRLLRENAFAPSHVRIHFLNTDRFSGFCQTSKNMSRVVTMHANCCIGLENKLLDLRRALRAWEAAKSLPPAAKSLSPAANTTGVILWHVPRACRHSIWPPRAPPPPITQGLAT